jgi:glycosyltransferase involved in cell wall biosynthesis
MAETPRISVLVPTMGNPWHLSITILSACKYAAGPLEVLVYSNEHIPEIDQVVADHQAAGRPVRLVAFSPDNDGVAKAVNALAREARGEFVFYTGDDVYLLPGWDTALMRQMTPDPEEWVYLTPRMIEPTGHNPTMYAPHAFGTRASNFREEALQTFWGGLAKQHVVSCAGPPFMRRTAWEKLGGFDEAYWPGFATDPDLVATFRARALHEQREPQFIGVGDCGCYHYQCVTTARVRTVARAQAANQRFRDKWGMSTRELSRLIGDGRPL